ncbi:MAG: hypothetical protein BWY93_02279 [Euryarchaeota archaeon ADurb.BinA087]|nr:MAG: hypothetical protein BWY93_02279 [Euryarchaeota archaeon ADurb.BinA087]
MFKLLGEAHDVDRLERAFLYADPAADTELFRDDRLLILADDDRLVSCPHPRTVQDAFGAAFPGMAPVTVDYCDTHGWFTL